MDKKEHQIIAFDKVTGVALVYRPLDENIKNHPKYQLAQKIAEETANYGKKL